MTSLTDNFLHLVMAFLDHAPPNDGQFGRRAVGNGGFVASNRKGHAPRLDIADRTLRFMGEPTICPSFRAEIAAFPLITGTKGTVFGQHALRGPFFVSKLNSGASPQLSTIQRVRTWMRKSASYGERAVIAQAIADPGVPDPVLNPDPAALDALVEGTARSATDGESLPEECSHPIEQKILLTTFEAATFLNLKPLTLSHYRAVGGPVYCRPGPHIRYSRTDLLAWAWARRQGSLLEAR